MPTPMFRALAALGAALSLSVPGYARAQSAAGSSPKTRTRQPPEPIALESLLTPVVRDTRVPAIGAALVTRSGVLAIGVSGQREVGASARVTREDQWHIGSCGKAITAVTVARLVARGQLSWESTVAELWPDSTRHPGWNQVTIAQLLSHRGGMRHNPDDAYWADVVRGGSDLPQQRAALAQRLFAEPPALSADSATIYSNAAYLAVGAMVERRLGRAWETVVRREVLEPLGMSRSGFGAPPVTRASGQARGHVEDHTGLHAVPIGPGDDNPAVGAPVGTLHVTLNDWARFIATLLRGVNGDSTYLPAAQWRRLLTPGRGADYALGWKVVRDTTQRAFTLEHVGSNGFWIAQASLAPGQGYAVLLTSNAAVDRLEQPFDVLRRMLSDSAATWCARVACRGAPETGPRRTRRLQAFVDSLVKREGFHGVALVEERGVAMVHRAYGLADRAFAVPMRTDMRFKVASITKLFTATLVMQLVDAGRLRVDQSVSELLPEIASPNVQRLTVRQLLTHTSGLAQWDTVSSYAAAVRHGIPSYQLPRSLEVQAEDAVRRGVSAPPDSVFDYNNGEYFILGRIIERITGTSFEDVCRNMILAPLALRHTGIARAQALIDRLAETYSRVGDGPQVERDLPIYPENGWSAAGMYSTTDDLARFARALYGGQLLRPESLAQLLTPNRDEYGFGLWVSSHAIDGRPHRFAQRPGRVMGANVTLLRYLDDDLTIVLLSNTNLSDIDGMSFRIGREALRDPR